MQRMKASEFQQQFGSAVGNQIVGKKPAIRLPKKDKMTKGEAEYGRILRSGFPNFEIKYEAISFRLDGGVYTPDWTVWDEDRLVMCVECKGSFRLQSAGRSHFAFKAAAKAWPNIRWRFAQWTKDGWAVTEY